MNKINANDLLEMDDFVLEVRFSYSELALIIGSAEATLKNLKLISKMKRFKNDSDVQTLLPRYENLLLRLKEQASNCEKLFGEK